MVRILSFLTCQGAASCPPLLARAARPGPRGNRNPIAWAVWEPPICHVIFTGGKGNLFAIIFVLLLLSQPTLENFKCPQHSRRESYHLQSGPCMEVIFRTQSSELEKLPHKPLCCTVHLEPCESIFSPGKVKCEDIGKEHISAGSSSAHGQSFSVKHLWLFPRQEPVVHASFSNRKAPHMGESHPLKRTKQCIGCWNMATSPSQLHQYPGLWLACHAQLCYQPREVVSLRNGSGSN